MTASEDRIVNLLASEWQEGLRITTIPQAMARLGVSDDEEMRWRIATRMERVWRRRLGWRSLWRGLRWFRRVGSHPLRTWLGSFGRLPSMVTEAREWNPAVYTLSNGEKLMARYILGVGEVPEPDEIRTALDPERKTVETGLRMLARLGFLTGAAGGYRLTSGHERFLAGLGFTFHTVTLENGERFNVP